MKKTTKYIIISLVVITSISTFLFETNRPRLLRASKELGYGIKNIEDTSLTTIYPGWNADNTGITLAVPIYTQKYSLSCEVTSLRMALAYRGAHVSEDELIANLEVATLAPPTFDNTTNEITWGDPNKGFVGLINGKMPTTGYGVYEQPILNLALKYHGAEILADATIDSLVHQIILSHPVIVWGSVTEGKDTSWKDEFGNTILAIEGEHARVVVGFKGKPDAPTDILIIDPIYGKIQMTTQEFEKDWALLGSKAVAID